MNRVALFVSDLHLSRGDELEDFSSCSEASFVRFLSHQSTSHAGDEIDLVLLGDILDLWQVVPDTEKSALDSVSIPITSTPAEEASRVHQVCMKHRLTFTALRDFVMAGVAPRRLIIVIGNHDHSLVEPEVRDVLLDAISGGDSAVTGRVSVEQYYDCPELRLYAEHGGQLDANNAYADFSSSGRETPGYFFVRLFWNRLEKEERHIEHWSKCFAVIWQHKLWALLPMAVRFFWQYKRDPRVFPRIDVPYAPFFATPDTAIGASQSALSLAEFPDVLISTEVAPNRVFATDATLENKFRSLYYDSREPGFRTAVDEILRQKQGGLLPTVPAVEVTQSAFGLLPEASDPYVTAVGDFFAAPGEAPRRLPLKGRALQKGAYRYVILGHTHEPKRERLLGTRVMYYNTGAWIDVRDRQENNVSELTYVKVTRKPDGKTTAVQAQWPVASGAG